MGGLLEKKKLFPYLYRTLAKKKNSSRNYQLKQNSDFSFYVSNKDSGGKYIPFLQKTQYGFLRNLWPPLFSSYFLFNLPEKIRSKPG
jgi:hypothetical protein